MSFSGVALQGDVRVTSPKIHEAKISSQTLHFHWLLRKFVVGIDQDLNCN